MIHVRPSVLAVGEARVPTSVAAAAVQHRGRTDITLFTRPGVEPEDQISAALDAFDHLYSRSGHLPRRLPVHVNQADVRRALGHVAGSFPAVELVGSAPGRFQRLLHAAGAAIADQARDAEETLAEQEAERLRTLPDLVVATDASKSRLRAGAGVACVSADGRYRQKMCPTAESVLLGELLAIKLAATTFRNVPLRILTDSQHAVRALNKPGFADTITADRRVQTAVAQIHRLCAGRRVHVEWVRGHSGHQLNEIADRLAVAARRCHEARLDTGQSHAIAEQIIEDLRLRAQPLSA